MDIVKKENAIDMLVTLIIEKLSEDLQMDPDGVFSRSIFSKTAGLLYDETSKLWWNNPSDIAEMFCSEISQ